MTSLKQFWTLLKFQPLTNPFVLLMPVAFSMPLLLPFLMRSATSGVPDFHPSLWIYFNNQNLFLVGFLAMFWLVPEVMANAKWTTGTEFFLTRAVNRNLVYRARVVVFYLLIGILPLVVLMGSLKDPRLQISESAAEKQTQILAHVPGSYAAPESKSSKIKSIIIPRGKILVNGYNLWVFLLCGVGAQMLISLVYPFKYRKFILFGLFFSIVFLPLFLSLRDLKDRTVNLSLNESTFLHYADYQLFFWIALGGALLFGQWWCERRFVRSEF